jgi:hypothetical protein
MTFDRSPATKGVIDEQQGEKKVRKDNVYEAECLQ